MLQISQTENPMCSATIDQMRLRRAMTLPLVFQNVSSSGFHSEIQVGFGVLIENFLSERARHLPSGSRSKAWERAPGRPRSGGVTIRMIGFEGRLQWRQLELFKLRAKPLQCKNYLNYNGLVTRSNLLAEHWAHLKCAVRSFLVRRTKNEQLQEQGLFQASSVAAIIGFGAIPAPGFRRKS